MKRSDGELLYAIGASRSGKTVFMCRYLERKKRVLIWDTKGQYAQKFRHKNILRITNIPDLVRAIKNNKSNQWISYVSSDKKQFGMFCALAFNWGKQAPCNVVVEEIAYVTTAAKAAGDWGRLICQGLEYGINIYVTTQRPQGADKDIIGNASRLVIFRNTTEKDRRYVGDSTGIDTAMMPLEKLHFLNWWPHGEVQRGILTF
jgi:hypothetical protein